MIPDHIIKEINERCDCRTLVPGASATKQSSYVPCPVCGADKKGKCLRVSAKYAYCGSCKLSLNPIGIIQQYEGLSFIDAVKKLASLANVILPEDARPKSKSPKKPAQATIAKLQKNKRKAFVLQQLESSGLSEKDVMASVYINPDDEKPTLISPFRSGGISRGNNGKLWVPNDEDDEMLIYYYDRKGRPRKYIASASKSAQYIRVRWSLPESHAIDSKPMKYQSPPGSEAIIYIPEAVRAIYLSGGELDTLFIQEGEKKAEKACKHGVMSIAIQGIWNIGNKKSGIDRELQYLAQGLNVKRFVLLLDADWNDISAGAASGDEISTRPASFAGAVIKFKDYISTLRSVGLDADVYFGHVNKTASGDKGLDDLLCNTLKGKEDGIRLDVEKAFNAHDGHGDYVSLHKISTFSDFRIKSFWALDDRDTFIKAHEAELRRLKEFRFQGILYDSSGETIKVSERIASERRLWTTETNDKGNTKITFGAEAALEFLEKNGFRRHKRPQDSYKTYSFVRYENGIIRLVAPYAMRNFFVEYIRQETKSELVRDALLECVNRLLGEDRLENLCWLNMEQPENSIEEQWYYYKNVQVRITAEEVAAEALVGPVWDTRVIDRKFKRLPILTDIHAEPDGRISFRVTPDGRRCEFLRFLENTSYTGKRGEALNAQQTIELQAHMINKISALGYLLHQYRNLAESVVVVSEDMRITEDMKAMGGTGKSLIGDALKKMTSYAFINGKRDLNTDNFLLSMITPDTRVVIVDDVLKSFRFDVLYTAATSDIEVNQKQQARFLIPKEKAPKIYLSTNYAIKSDEDSTERRIVYIAFSEWYSKEYTPYSDFGHILFEDWDEEQFNLFDNLMLDCVMVYLRSLKNNWAAPGRGVIPPPMKDIDRKKWLHSMSPTFLDWADRYFNPEDGKLNMRINRKDMFENFRINFPDTKNISSNNFRDRLLAYCRYKGYHFNANRPHKDTKELYHEWRSYHKDSFVGDRDLSAGIDYFSVWSSAQADKEMF